MEVLSLLKHEPSEIAAIWRLKFDHPSSTLEKIPVGSSDSLQVLEHGRNGSYVFFYRRKLRRTRSSVINFWRVGGFLSMPFEIRNGRVRFAFLGNNREVRAFLGLFEKIGVRYRVDLLTDATFSLDSTIGRLTEKQRNVIISAFNLGYYDVPRRIRSPELAERLGITVPAFVMHRRKAEHKIVSELLTKDSAKIS